MNSFLKEFSPVSPEELHRLSKNSLIRYPQARLLLSVLIEASDPTTIISMPRQDSLQPAFIVMGSPTPDLAVASIRFQTTTFHGGITTSILSIKEVSLDHAPSDWNNYKNQFEVTTSEHGFNEPSPIETTEYDFPIYTQPTINAEGLPYPNFANWLSTRITTPLSQKAIELAKNQPAIIVQTRYPDYLEYYRD